MREKREKRRETEEKLRVGTQEKVRRRGDIGGLEESR